jgi:hypothetical protein
MDGFGAYFGDNTIDTITHCTIPLTYLTPQVKNPPGNAITDTLNWVPITGTFTATGNEKYMVIGNFLADNAVTTASIGGPYFPQQWTDVYIDDVSCIEVDLPAYAGPDKFIINGDSAFIGREPDFAVDKGCFWYKLPGMEPLDTISGLWVKPVVTTTYVVKQELECSALKWDTVVVYVDYVGLSETENSKFKVKAYPVPADGHIFLEIDGKGIHMGYMQFSIVNLFGQSIREGNVVIKEKVTQISTENFPEGIYFLKLSAGGKPNIVKRFVISR